MHTKIIGSYISPYVRKVLACLELKGVQYQIDPIVPFYGNEEFSRISPVRRVPVLIDDAVIVCDSTVICEYLEERYASLPLLPKSPAQRARCRWLEEFADSRMGEVFIWHFFNELVIKRAVWGEKPNEEVLRKAREEEIPQTLDYIESQLGSNNLFFDEVTIADLAVASFFRTAMHARFAVDTARWPKTAAFVAKMLELPSFQKLKAFEDSIARTPIADHRTVLRAAGAPLTDETFGASTPRRGVLSTK